MLAPPPLWVPEIFLKYLPKQTTESQLSDFFGECGEIVGEPVLMRDTA